MSALVKTLVVLWAFATIVFAIHALSKISDEIRANAPNVPPCEYLRIREGSRFVFHPRECVVRFAPGKDAGQ